jgi:hypothetical protein
MFRDREELLDRTENPAIRFTSLPRLIFGNAEEPTLKTVLRHIPPQESLIAMKRY